MRRCPVMLVQLLVSGLGVTQTVGQQPVTSQPATSQPAANPVAAMVNGEPVLETAIDEIFDDIVRQQTQGRAVPPQVIEQARSNLRPQILNALIDNRLLDANAKQMNITVAPQECLKAVQQDLSDSLLRSGVSREEFAQQLQTLQAVTVDEFLKQRAEEPGLRQALTHAKLLETLYPQDLAVTADQILKHYNEQRDTVYSQPEKVRASHILVSVAPNATAEVRAEARAKIDALLPQVRAAEADFADLARNHSDCSSRPQGGDLGFFPRNGVMVEPFAAKAFELGGVGQVSDVVETQFGYHIIKLTDRKPAVVISLDQARHAIQEELKTAKLGEIRKQHSEKLRGTAQIVLN